jgi:hypothetical protein
MTIRSAFFRTTLMLLALTVAGVAGFAQEQEKPKPAESKPAASKAKAGQEASCDGALEIVPRKQVTFLRKRRPAPAATPSADGPADAKPDKKPESKPATK